MCIVGACEKNIEWEPFGPSGGSMGAPINTCQKCLKAFSLVFFECLEGLHEQNFNDQNEAQKQTLKINSAVCWILYN